MKIDRNFSLKIYTTWLELLLTVYCFPGWEKKKSKQIEIQLFSERHPFFFNIDSFLLYWMYHLNQEKMSFE